MPTIAVPTIVTAEDDPITRRHLRLVLEDAGFDVVADARDGDEAVELAREHRPDLMLIDLGLPGLDGVEAIRRILDDSRLPIVALTSRSASDAGEALDAGAVSLLHKPVGGEEVVTTLRDALAKEPHPAERDESRAAIASLLELLGYPTEWADDFADKSIRQGRVWRRLS
jgi:response regulator NasT